MNPEDIIVFFILGFVILMMLFVPPIAEHFVRRSLDEKKPKKRRIRKFFKRLLRPNYNGPTVEEIARDMKRDKK